MYFFPDEEDVDAPTPTVEAEVDVLELLTVEDGARELEVSLAGFLPDEKGAVASVPVVDTDLDASDPLIVEEVA